MQEIVNDLLQRIATLEREMSNLKASSTIPLPIDQAFRGRFKFIASVSAGSAGSTTVYNAFPVTVPANPSGTLVVQLPDGTTKELLCK